MSPTAEDITSVDKTPTAEASMPLPMQAGSLTSESEPEMLEAVSETSMPEEELIVDGKKDVKVVEGSVTVVGINEVKAVCTNEVEESALVLEPVEDESPGLLVLGDPEPGIVEDANEEVAEDEVDDEVARLDERLAKDEQLAHPVRLQSLLRSS